MSVRTKPGATAFTVIPRDATSRAADLVKPINAALLAASIIAVGWDFAEEVLRDFADTAAIRVLLLAAKTLRQRVGDGGEGVTDLADFRALLVQARDEAALWRKVESVLHGERCLGEG